MPDSYWPLIDPYWDRVSIYDGPATLANDLRNVPLPAQHVLAAHWCQSEVCNGGLRQFFDNSTGVLAPEAAAGFRAIGMPQLAALLQRAMAFFGANYPRERDARQRALFPATPDGDEPPNPFDDMDEEFYSLLDTEAGGWEEAARRYAAANAG